jgi:hypothetical protein
MASFLTALRRVPGSSFAFTGSLRMALSSCQIDAFLLTKCVVVSALMGNWQSDQRNSLVRTCLAVNAATTRCAAASSVQLRPSIVASSSAGAACRLGQKLYLSSAVPLIVAHDLRCAPRETHQPVDWPTCNCSTFTANLPDSHRLAALTSLRRRCDSPETCMGNISCASKVVPMAATMEIVACGPLWSALRLTTDCA